VVGIPAEAITGKSYTRQSKSALPQPVSSVKFSHNEVVLKAQYKDR
jgi:hypothetical protein